MNILVLGDSLSWGIIPGTRERLPFKQRWPGILQTELGPHHRVIEECLNGRTTCFEDPNRPARNALTQVQMLIESHSPIDLCILMLGTNDFQDIIGASAEQSAIGLRKLVLKIQSVSAEPMKSSPPILVIIPPQIQKPLGQMAQKFLGFSRGTSSESTYLNALKDLEVTTLLASQCVHLSKVDGVHLDSTEHQTLAKFIAASVITSSAAQ